MPYNTSSQYKNWQNFPDTSTPWNAAAAEDLEARVAAYAEQYASGRMNFINVLDLGAARDNTDPTGTTSAIQTAINLAQLGNGGTVYLPRGTYAINSAITFPANVHIDFRGQGNGMNSGLTVLDAAAGYTGSILSGVGSGSSPGSGTFMKFNLYGLLIQGNNTTSSSPLVDIGHCVETHYEQIHVTNCNHQIGWRETCMFNVSHKRCRVTNSGEGTAKPAMQLTGDPNGNSAENNNTVFFTDCQWEQNFGTSLELTGQNNSQRTEFTTITGGKIEASNNAGAYPFIRFGLCRRCVVQGMHFGVNGGSGAAIDSVGGTATNIVQGCIIGGSSTASYGIDVQSGAVVVGDCVIDNIGSGNTPWPGGIRYGSGAGPDANLVHNTAFFVDASAIVDNRTGRRSTQRGYNRHIQNTGAASTTAIAANSTGTLATITVTGAAMGDIVRVSHSGALQAGITMNGRVTSANTVTVTGANTTGASITPVAGTIKAVVEAVS